MEDGVRQYVMQCRVCREMIAPLMFQDWGAFVLVPDKIVLSPWRLRRHWGERRESGMTERRQRLGHKRVGRGLKKSLSE